MEAIVARAVDGGAVASFSVEADDPGLDGGEFLLYCYKAGSVFFWDQISNASGGAFDQVGEANAVRGQERIFFGCKQAICEPSFEEEAPELVAPPGIVMANMGRAQAGIEAYEDEVEAGLEVIWQHCGNCGRQYDLTAVYRFV